MKLAKCSRALLITVFSVGMMTSCAEVMDEVPEEPTQVATATGAAVGAGLGAIIGSQTGDALGGTAIGAVAGAGAGYAVGNYIEDRDGRLVAREERMQRQEQQLKSQRQQIDELRGGSGDPVQYRSGGASPRAHYTAGSVSYQSGGSKTYVDPATLNNPFASSPKPLRVEQPREVALDSLGQGGSFGNSAYSGTPAYGSATGSAGRSVRMASGDGPLIERSLGAENSDSQYGRTVPTGNDVGTTTVAPTARIPSFDAPTKEEGAFERDIEPLAKTSGSINAGTGVDEDALFDSARSQEARAAKVADEEIEVGINATEETPHNTTCRIPSGRS